MQLRNEFTNTNVENWFRWLFRTKDNLSGVGVYFLSKRYSTSPRHFPLYNNSENIRIILFKGSRFPGVDRLILKLIDLFLKCSAEKFRIYKYNFVFTPKITSRKYCSEIYNFDDPEYTKLEADLILNWEKCLKSKGLTSKIVCTTNYTKQYLVNLGSTSIITVIPQGHSGENTIDKDFRNQNPKSLVKLVYASPYIDIKGDYHSRHVNWNASNLIEIIWENLRKYDHLQLNLIGRVGSNARKKLSNSNVVFHGLVSISECSNILTQCDLALYPRTYDNKRQAQKVIEYIGAGLPTIGFNTIDCKIIEELNVGILVGSMDQFINSVLDLSRNLSKLESLKSNCREVSSKFSWRYLSKEFDNLLND